MTATVSVDPAASGGELPEMRVRRVIQVVADLARRPLSELRILDLACLSGYFAVECGAMGATVLGIEGRMLHVEAARALARHHGVSSVEFVQDDVRNLSKEKYGEFDLVLCLGILYHLDAPDVFDFVQRVAEVCRDFALIDTHFSLAPELSCVWRGQRYWGSQNEEHPADASAEEKLQAAWDSLDNVKDFWLTRPSLCNLLRDVGFTSVYECRNPSDALYEGGEPKFWRDRLMLVACKGRPVTSLVWPVLNGVPDVDWPERIEEHWYCPPVDYKPGKRDAPSAQAAAGRFGMVGSLGRSVWRAPRAVWKAMRRQVQP